MSPELLALLDAARRRPMTDEERWEQRISFAYGNAGIENAAVTREAVERAANEIATIRKLRIVHPR